MNPIVFTILLCISLVAGGCADREKERELQTQLEKNSADRASLQSALTDREQFVE